MSETFLNIQNLTAHIGANGVGVLRDISLSVKAGEVHGLVGESGAGKSMIAKAVLGLLPPALKIISGSIQFQGRELIGLSERNYRKILGRDITLIPQDPLSALNPTRRIEAQMIDVMHLHNGWSRKKCRHHALTLLEEVQLRDPVSVLKRYPHELSGGMRQRILIAIAFACDPKLIIADEPTTALDVTVQKQVLRLLRAMQDRHGTAILFVTHDLGVVAKICNHVTVLHSGMVIEQGSVASIIERPNHPFTQALFAATPRFDRAKTGLHPVPDDITHKLTASAQAFDRQRHGKMKDTR